MSETPTAPAEGEKPMIETTTAYSGETTQATYESPEAKMFRILEDARSRLSPEDRERADIEVGQIILKEYGKTIRNLRKALAHAVHRNHPPTPACAGCRDIDTELAMDWPE